jgi:dienelactone hydrolase
MSLTMPSQQPISLPCLPTDPTTNNAQNALKHINAALTNSPTPKRRKKSHNRFCSLKLLTIHVSKHDAHHSFSAYLHVPQNYNYKAPEACEQAAVILMSGASGGVEGPSGMYASLADQIASLRRGVPVLRMDYRFPGETRPCVADVLAAMDYLRRNLAVTRFVLVGWSFGSIPTMTVSGHDDRVIGCAAIASQSADATVLEGVESVAAKGLPLLLLHGTRDRMLKYAGSEKLLRTYQQRVRDGGDMGFLQLFEGDDHALTESRAKAQAMLCAFVLRCAGVEVGGDEEVVVCRKDSGAGGEEM